MSNPTLPTLDPALTPQPSGIERPPAWRFWAAMLVQSALIVAVPFQSAITYATGQTVTIQTAPVDPYDFIRGYSQTLSFDISRAESLRALPGGRDVFGRSDYTDLLIYVVLQAPEADQAEGDMPAVWEPVAVRLDRPESLLQNQVALKGRYDGGRVQYGLETYYMPEAQRDDINQQIREVQGSGMQAFVVDVKVDDKGNSVPVSLWVDGDRYRF